MVNDTTSWSVTLELSGTLLESSIMLPENIYCTGVTHDNCHMMTQEILRGKAHYN